MGSDRDEALVRGLAHARRRSLPLAPAVRAILWFEAVLFFAVMLALFGKPPAIGNGTSVWSWIALAGATLTAATAALAAFELGAPGRSNAWTWLPAPALVLWAGASGMGCFGAAGGTSAWGHTLDEAAQCFKFLLAISAPLLALIVFMLRQVAQRVRLRVMTLGGLASAGAAAILLALVHPHDATLLDLGAHAIAVAIVLGASAAATLVPQLRKL